MRIWKRFSVLGLAAAVVLCVLSQAAGASERVPVKNKRVAVFSDDAFPVKNGAKPASWYEGCLKYLGCTPVVADAREISDGKYLSKKKIDTLIIPDSSRIPVESVYSIINFLAEGGNVILSSIPRYGVKYDAAAGAWAGGIDIGGDRRSEFQIQYNYFPKAQKSLNAEMSMNPACPSVVQATLPSKLEAVNRNFGPLDKMSGWAGDETTGANTALVANIIFPVYSLPDGNATDFVAYRYHNIRIKDATLVHLGNVGAGLMSGMKASDTLEACLLLCEAKFPGEQSPDFYNRFTALQERMSGYGQDWAETVYLLNDRMQRSYYSGKESKAAELQNHLKSCYDMLSGIVTEKDKIDLSIAANKNTGEQDAPIRRLLDTLDASARKMQAMRASAVQVPGGSAAKPAGIQNSLGGMFLEAGITAPVGLYTFREDFFQTVKKLGLSTCSLQWDEDVFRRHLDDPHVRKNAEGVSFMVRSVPPDGYLLPYEGTLNPTNGTVTVNKNAEEYNYGAVEEKVKQIAEKWKGLPVNMLWPCGIRTGESGLGNHFWGGKDALEYIAALKKKYGSIENLNRQWQSGYKDFSEITLLTKKPESALEHGNWEDWIQFREDRYCSALKFLKDAFRKYMPGVPVTFCTSTGSISCATYGVNYYKISKLQDVVGIDGTSGTPPTREWIWFDLIGDKQFLTTENGVFYHPQFNAIKWNDTLTDEIWASVSGGAIGVNCWMWSFMANPGAFVDATGRTTIAGWNLKNVVADAKKIENIIMDGKRVQPDVRILYSNTSRVHDQTWGDWGTTTSSAHLQTVDNLYALCQETQTSARVIPEEAILEGADLSRSRLIIVPHAQYMSQKLQNELLGYVKRGGNILIEGESGKFDNYGRYTNLLFKAVSAVRAPVRERRIPSGDSEIGLLRSCTYTYSPSLLYPEKGKVLLSYKSGEPALISVPVGKGRIIVSGVPFGLRRVAFSSMMDRVFSEISLDRDFTCTNKRMLVRRWQYSGGEYLICSNPKGGERVGRFTMRVKGSYKVSDYMLNTGVPATFDGKYTSFTGTMVSPGLAVYALAPAKYGRQVASAQPGVKSQAQGAVAAASGKLPFKGILYSAQPVQLGGYIFDLNCITSADRDDVGEAYLTVKSGRESSKQRIESGRSYTFFIGGKAVQVNCIVCHFKFPLCAEVAVTEGAGAASVSACSFGQQGNELVLSNGIVRVKVRPGQGARIVEFATLPDGVSQLNFAGGDGGIQDEQAQWGGRFSGQPFSWKIVENTPDSVKVHLKMERAVDGLLLEKTIGLKKNQANIDLEVKEFNVASAPAYLTLRLHPMLAIGGTVDGSDCFYLPASGGMRVVQFEGWKGGSSMLAGSDWAALCDAESRIAYISRFEPSQVQRIYTWLGSNSYTLELFSPSQNTAPMKSLDMNTGLFLVKGISGVDGFAGGIAEYTSLSRPFISQAEKTEIPVEIGSASSVPKKVSARVCLARDGKEIKELGAFDGSVSWNRSLEKSVQLYAPDVPDGAYSVTVAITGEDGKELLKTAKPVQLVRSANEEMLAAYEGMKKRLRSLLDGGVESDDAYPLFSRIEDFHFAIEANNPEAASRIRAEIESAFSSLKK